MDPPSEESLLKALEQLYLLRAVEKDSKEEDKLRLTPLGKRMAHFPLEPNLSKAIIMSQDHGCTEEVVTIVSMLSVDSVLFTPRDKQEEASAARKKFVSSDGDHITLLQMYRGYKSAKGNKVCGVRRNSGIIILQVKEKNYLLFIMKNINYILLVNVCKV